MGEIADMMLDGTLCECCGCYIGSDAGFPQYCSDECAADRGALAQRSSTFARTPVKARYDAVTKVAKPYTCQIDGCGKRFASQADKRRHRRMKHEAAQ